MEGDQNEYSVPHEGEIVDLPPKATVDCLPRPMKSRSPSGSKCVCEPLTTAHTRDPDIHLRADVHMQGLCDHAIYLSGGMSSTTRHSLGRVAYEVCCLDIRSLDRMGDASVSTFDNRSIDQWGNVPASTFDIRSLDTRA